MGDKPEKLASIIQPDIAFEALRGCVPVEFPADSHFTHANFLIDSVTSATITGGLYTQLVAFGDQVFASLHEILLAAIRILHQRYSGVVRAAIGTSTCCL